MLKTKHAQTKKPAGKKSGKSQSNKTSDAADKTDKAAPSKTPAGDDDSADDDSAADKGDDDQHQQDDEQEWLDDDLKAQVSTLGISDEQLAEFGSREELERAMRLLDIGAMNAGRHATGKKGDPKPKDDEQVQRSVSKPQEQPRDDAIDKVQLNPEIYDEEVLKDFSRVFEHYESRLRATNDRIAQIIESEQQRTARAEEERFDSIVDTLGHADLFGEAGKETKEQLANRHKLFDEHRVYLAGLKALGREGKTDKSFVTRVLNMTFAEHLSKQQRKQLTQKITRQSNMRMGGGVSKPTDPPEDIYTKTERLYEELSRD